MSLLESKIIRDCIDEKKYETIEEKRSRADKVKEDKARIKDRIKRYEVTLTLYSNSRSSRVGRTTSIR